jgi:uncharacterized protein YpiB (UPF0302 family)
MENTYSEISEMIYWASHDKDENEIKVEKQPEWIEYNLSPIIDLALDTNDKEWFMELINR